MARGDILIRYETRPCIYRRLMYAFEDPTFDLGKREFHDERAIWHAWVQKPGNVYALIELQDGHVELVRSETIRFVDNAFSEMYWPEEE